MNSLREIAKMIYHNIWCKIIYHIRLVIYWAKIPLKVKRIRKKQQIRVLFVVSEVASWKSELLYQEMLNHPRFQPIIGISTSKKPWGAKKELVSYLKKKGYEYKDLDTNRKSIDIINPEIIFYYKPYSACYSEGHFFSDNLQYVFCGMDYCFEATKHAVHIEKELFDYCWQFYVENNDIAKRREEVLGYRARNTIITGVPMQDLLLQPKESFDDPWNDCTGKKRIIYAPHHSIKGTNGEGIEFATFLEYGEFILELAKKYADKITIAFKPHPNLYMKLLRIWGEEKTISYYKEWDVLQNTQIVTGDYVALFKYSDAIIHDCASFIVEYLYVNKPSMYLIAETNNIDDMFSFVKEGYFCYEHGKGNDDIEHFINNVISNIDLKKTIRSDYYFKQLIPPGGNTACTNIINSILGGI